MQSIDRSVLYIVWNLGVIFDQNISFASQIKQVYTTALFHLRNI